MEQDIKGLLNSFLCELCKVKFSSHADYVLHEFSKKHCDNLIRLSKNKSIPQKHKKVKKEVEKEPEKEVPSVNNVNTQPGSFAKYGYFVPGEIYAMSEVQKEYNTDYDPYLQKFAENSFKETSIIENQVLLRSQTSATFCRKKRKKNRTCQICNLTLATVPEYDAHMKSPQHIWKLKVSGMGVSAHFVKASSDLHTTDVNESSKPTNQTLEESVPEISVAKESLTSPFPLLYCSDCELLLNSPQQYNIHVTGKAHIECAQKKAEIKAKKEKILNPAPNQLYCYSCQISLNNLFQYNEHKNGKKHLSKCRQLIKRGITIPPEERVPGLISPRISSNKNIIYPELYEKFVLEKQKGKQFTDNNEKSLNEATFCNTCNINFTSTTEYDLHYQISHNSKLSNNENINNNNNNINNNNNNNSSNCNPSFDKTEVDNNLKVNDKSSIEVESADSLTGLKVSVCDNSPRQNTTISSSVNNCREEIIKSIIVVERDGFVNCSICDQRFWWQTEYDAHLNSEDHFRKLLELKTKGMCELEILNIILSDSSCVKRNNLNKLMCCFCNITTNSDDEFYQHLKSVVHKYAFKDFKRKKTTEVYSIATANEKNLYFCKLCKEGWPVLLDFVQHLNFMKHRSLQSAEKAKKMLAKKRSMLLQKQTRNYNLKKNKSLWWRLKDEKNPGVRTKVAGVATNLITGTQESIANLEALEFKIDQAKNIEIGSQENTGKTLNLSKTKNERKISVSRKSYQLKVTHHNPGPSLGLGGPPRPNSFFRPHHPKSSSQFFPPFRNWSPYPSPYPPGPRPFSQTPYLYNNAYSEPYWFQRPRYPKFFK